MQTVSVRIPEDDLAWLAGLSAVEGSSPSDKIRGLIAEARRRDAGMASYMACLTLMREYVRPSQEGVMALEHRHAMHSEFLEFLFLRLPELMAVLITELPRDATEDAAVSGRKAQEAESKLAAGTMRLLSAILRQAVTQRMPAYDPALLNAYLPELVELIDLVKEPRNVRQD